MSGTDDYSIKRRDEHSTLGDAAQRYHRDADAFTAGAQYALDKIVAGYDELRRHQTLAPVVVSYLIVRAADILTNVHDGQL